MPSYNDDTDNYGAAADLGANGAKTLSSVKAGGTPAPQGGLAKFRAAAQDLMNPVFDSLDKQIRAQNPNMASDPDWEERMKKAGRRGGQEPSTYNQPNMTGARG